ncbi:MAG: peptidoglycan editing factor PgeF [Candidatus Omnitrophota bacterium]|nr:peptidoglycan editing factor PgeF [Candidatus Omnitrophota bacterium]MDD3982890.1 peptidoglycan editing factor PgeF [Candidatus Omnitrophota bacterium]MDD5526455.1 peptidoglycan editing factor PgeF [Candidatus Omnitrophota bacterium]
MTSEELCGIGLAFGRGRVNMSFRHGDKADVLVNRGNFLASIDAVPGRLVCCDQVHGGRAVEVTAADAGKGALSFETSVARADALVTRVPGLPLGILTADCLPVLLFDPAAPAAAAVHAGWRGSRDGIIGNTLRLMRERFGTRPKAVSAWLGPCIGQCCYRVSGEFREIFPGSVVMDGEDTFFDLSGFNKQALLACGVRSENIHGSGGLCTVCLGSDFFSYRREGDLAGRMLSVIILKQS